eukprot:gene5332-3831_t
MLHPTTHLSADPLLVLPSKAHQLPRGVYLLSLHGGRFLGQDTLQLPSGTARSWLLNDDRAHKSTLSRNLLDVQCATAVPLWISDSTRKEERCSRRRGLPSQMTMRVLDTVRNDPILSGQLRHTTRRSSALSLPTVRGAKRRLRAMVQSLSRPDALVASHCGALSSLSWVSILELDRVEASKKWRMISLAMRQDTSHDCWIHATPSLCTPRATHRAVFPHAHYYFFLLLAILVVAAAEPPPMLHPTTHLSADPLLVLPSKAHQLPRGVYLLSLHGGRFLGQDTLQLPSGTARSWLLNDDRAHKLTLSRNLLDVQCATAVPLWISDSTRKEERCSRRRGLPSQMTMRVLDTVRNDPILSGQLRHTTRRSSALSLPTVRGAKRRLRAMVQSLSRPDALVASHCGALSSLSWVSILELDRVEASKKWRMISLAMRQDTSHDLHRGRCVPHARYSSCSGEWNLTEILSAFIRFFPMHIITFSFFLLFWLLRSRGPMLHPTTHLSADPLLVLPSKAHQLPRGVYLLSLHGGRFLGQDTLQLPSGTARSWLLNDDRAHKSTLSRNLLDVQCATAVPLWISDSTRKEERCSRRRGLPSQMTMRVLDTVATEAHHAAFQCTLSPHRKRRLRAMVQSLSRPDALVASHCGALSSLSWVSILELDRVEASKKWRMISLAMRQDTSHDCWIHATPSLCTPRALLIVFPHAHYYFFLLLAILVVAAAEPPPMLHPTTHLSADPLLVLPSKAHQLPRGVYLLSLHGGRFLGQDTLQLPSGTARSWLLNDDRAHKSTLSRNLLDVQCATAVPLWISDSTRKEERCSRRRGLPSQMTMRVLDTVATEAHHAAFQCTLSPHRKRRLRAMVQSLSRPDALVASHCGALSSLSWVSILELDRYIEVAVYPTRYSSCSGEWNLTEILSAFISRGPMLHPTTHLSADPLLVLPSKAHQLPRGVYLLSLHGGRFLGQDTLQLPSGTARSWLLNDDRAHKSTLSRNLLDVQCATAVPLWISDSTRKEERCSRRRGLPSQMTMRVLDTVATEAHHAARLRAMVQSLSRPDALVASHCGALSSLSWVSILELDRVEASKKWRMISLAMRQDTSHDCWIHATPSLCTHARYSSCSGEWNLTEILSAFISRAPMLHPTTHLSADPLLVLPSKAHQLPRGVYLLSLHGGRFLGQDTLQLPSGTARSWLLNDDRAHKSTLSRNLLDVQCATAVPLWISDSTRKEERCSRRRGLPSQMTMRVLDTVRNDPILSGQLRHTTRRSSALSLPTVRGAKRRLRAMVQSLSRPDALVASHCGALSSLSWVSILELDRVEASKKWRMISLAMRQDTSHDCWIHATPTSRSLCTPRALLIHSLGFSPCTLLLFPSSCYFGCCGSRGPMLHPTTHLSADPLLVLPSKAHQLPRGVYLLSLHGGRFLGQDTLQLPSGTARSWLLNDDRAHKSTLSRNLLDVQCATAVPLWISDSTRKEERCSRRRGLPSQMTMRVLDTVRNDPILSGQLRHTTRRSSALSLPTVRGAKRRLRAMVQSLSRPDALVASHCGALSSLSWVSILELDRVEASKKWRMISLAMRQDTSHDCWIHATPTSRSLCTPRALLIHSLGFSPCTLLLFPSSCYFGCCGSRGPMLHPTTHLSADPLLVLPSKAHQLPRGVYLLSLHGGRFLGQDTLQLPSGTARSWLLNDDRAHKSTLSRNLLDVQCATAVPLWISDSTRKEERCSRRRGLPSQMTMRVLDTVRNDPILSGQLRHTTRRSSALSLPTVRGAKRRLRAMVQSLSRPDALVASHCGALSSLSWVSILELDRVEASKKWRMISLAMRQDTSHDCWIHATPTSRSLCTPRATHRAVFPHAHYYFFLLLAILVVAAAEPPPMLHPTTHLSADPLLVLPSKAHQLPRGVYLLSLHGGRFLGQDTLQLPSGTARSWLLNDDRAHKSTLSRNLLDVQCATAVPLWISDSTRKEERCSRRRGLPSQMTMRVLDTVRNDPILSGQLRHTTRRSSALSLPTVRGAKRRLRAMVQSLSRPDALVASHCGALSSLSWVSILELDRYIEVAVYPTRYSSCSGEWNLTEILSAFISRGPMLHPTTHLSADPLLVLPSKAHQLPRGVYLLSLHGGRFLGQDTLQLPSGTARSWLLNDDRAHKSTLSRNLLDVQCATAVPLWISDSTRKEERCSRRRGLPSQMTMRVLDTVRNDPILSGQLRHTTRRSSALSLPTVRGAKRRLRAMVQSLSRPDALVASHCGALSSLSWVSILELDRYIEVAVYPARYSSCSGEWNLTEILSAFISRGPMLHPTTHLSADPLLVLPSKAHQLPRGVYLLSLHGGRFLGQDTLQLPSGTARSWLLNDDRAHKSTLSRNLLDVQCATAVPLWISDSTRKEERCSRRRGLPSQMTMRVLDTVRNDPILSGQLRHTTRRSSALSLPTVRGAKRRLRAMVQSLSRPDALVASHCGALSSLSWVSILELDRYIEVAVYPARYSSCSGEWNLTEILSAFIRFFPMHIITFSFFLLFWLLRQPSPMLHPTTHLSADPLLVLPSKAHQLPRGVYLLSLHGGRFLGQDTLQLPSGTARSWLLNDDRAHKSTLSRNLLDVQCATAVPLWISDSTRKEERCSRRRGLPSQMTMRVLDTVRNDPILSGQLRHTTRRSSALSLPTVRGAKRRLRAMVQSLSRPDALVASHCGALSSLSWVSILELDRVEASKKWRMISLAMRQDTSHDCWIHATPTSRSLCTPRALLIVFPHAHYYFFLLLAILVVAAAEPPPMLHPTTHLSADPLLVLPSKAHQLPRGVYLLSLHGGRFLGQDTLQLPSGTARSWLLNDDRAHKSTLSRNLLDVQCATAVPLWISDSTRKEERCSRRRGLPSQMTMRVLDTVRNDPILSGQLRHTTRRSSALSLPTVRGAKRRLRAMVQSLSRPDALVASHCGALSSLSWVSILELDRTHHMIVGFTQRRKQNDCHSCPSFSLSPSTSRSLCTPRATHRAVFPHAHYYFFLLLAILVAAAAEPPPMLHPTTHLSADPLLVLPSKAHQLPRGVYLLSLHGGRFLGQDTLQLPSGTARSWLLNDDRAHKSTLSRNLLDVQCATAVPLWISDSTRKEERCSRRRGLPSQMTMRVLDTVRNDPILSGQLRHTTRRSSALSLPTVRGAKRRLRAMVQSLSRPDALVASHCGALSSLSWVSILELDRVEASKKWRMISLAMRQDTSHDCWIHATPTSRSLCTPRATHRAVFPHAHYYFFLLLAILVVAAAEPPPMLHPTTHLSADPLLVLPSKAHQLPRGVYLLSLHGGRFLGQDTLQLPSGTARSWLLNDDRAHKSTLSRNLLDVQCATAVPLWISDSTRKEERCSRRRGLPSQMTMRVLDTVRNDPILSGQLRHTTRRSSALSLPTVRGAKRRLRAMVQSLSRPDALVASHCGALSSLSWVSILELDRVEASKKWRMISLAMRQDTSHDCWIHATPSLCTPRALLIVFPHAHYYFFLLLAILVAAAAEPPPMLHPTTHLSADPLLVLPSKAHQLPRGVYLLSLHGGRFLGQDTLQLPSGTARSWLLNDDRAHKSTLSRNLLDVQCATAVPLWISDSTRKEERCSRRRGLQPRLSVFASLVFVLRLLSRMSKSSVGVQKRAREEEDEVIVKLQQRLAAARPISTLLSRDTLFSIGRGTAVGGADAAQERWSLHGWIDRSTDLAFCASFQSQSLPFDSNETADEAVAMLSRASCVYWAIIDVPRKKVFRCCEVDNRGAVAVMAVMTQSPGLFFENNYLGEAVAEQLHFNNMVIPDHCAEKGGSSASGVVDVKLGDCCFKCVRQKNSRMGFNLKLEGQTNEGLAPEKEMKIFLEVAFLTDTNPVLDGEHGIVSNGAWEENGFRYFIPSSRITRARLRIGRPSAPPIFDNNKIRHGSVWIDHEIRRVRPNTLQEMRILQNLSYNRVLSPHYTERCCLTLFYDEDVHISAQRVVNSLTGKTSHTFALLQPNKGVPLTCTVDFTHIKTKQYRSPVTGLLYSTSWSLSLRNTAEDLCIDVTLCAEVDEQEFVSVLANPSFWKGTVTVNGCIFMKGKPKSEVMGMGFMTVQGRRTLADTDQLFDMLRSAGIASLKTTKMSVSTLEEANKSDDVVVGASSIATVLHVQGFTVKETHKVVIINFLSTYLFICQHHEAERVAEALDWCHEKWMRFTTLSPPDYLMIFIRGFMLRELRQLLELQCTALIMPLKAQVSALDLVTPSYLGRLNRALAPELPPTVDLSHSAPSSLDCAVASAAFSGQWKEVKSLAVGSLRNLLLHEGGSFFWRYHQSLLNLTVFLNFPADSKVLHVKQTSFMLNYTICIPVDGSEVTWECLGRGEMKSRAILLANGKEIYVETRMQSGVEKLWFCTGDDKTLKEKIFFFSHEDDQTPVSCDENGNETDIKWEKMEAKPGDQVIDQKFLDKQSRTIGTYGLETMAKLISFKVLIVGCGGVGAEAAKNLALAGIHTISLLDSRSAAVRDMGVNFAVTMEGVRSRKPLAELTANYIAELNPNTRIRVVNDLSEKVVRQHNAVVITAGSPDLSLSYLCKWNKFCRESSISFLLAIQVGVFGSIFVDHGANFVVKDKDGRAMLQKSILEVSNRKDKEGESYSLIRFETPEGQTPGALHDYTRVKLSEIQGLVKEDGSTINNVVLDGVVCPGDPRNTIRVYPSFEAQGFSPYVTGGFLHEMKEIETLHFQSLEDAICKPGNFVQVSPMMDNSEESRSHITLHALLHYAEKHNGRLPSLHADEEAAEVVKCAHEILENNKRLPAPEAPPESGRPSKSEFPFKMPPPPPPVPLLVDNIDESYVKTQALIAEAEFQPLASFFGAVVAQEIVKITGKYSPVFQWFHLSCHDVLPDHVNYSSDDFEPHESRYHHLIAILGRTFHTKLGNLKIFMVGCGALGCEDVKNFALCGIACGRRGSLVVTDNDRIEVSNLSRQFLFREDNVGQPKSVAAGARMKQMNADAKVDARQDFVGPSTEHLFPCEFWSGLDVVVNALDNMEARLYVDQQCVRFFKILVEAGTMGTGGNVDIVVPGKTSSYADGGDADQSGGIPMCTLRNFPYIFDHCIEWSRAQFDDMFVSPMQTVNQLLEDPELFTKKLEGEMNAAQSDGEKRSIIEKNKGPLENLLKTLVILTEGPDMKKCAQMSVEAITKMFRDRIYDLQAAFPADAKKKNGELFWSGHRKYPSALEVSLDALLQNDEAINFLISTINLYACMFGIHPPKPEARFNDERHLWMEEFRSKEWLSQVLQSVTIPAYQPGQVEGLDDDLKGDAKDVKQTTLEEEERITNQLISRILSLAEQCRSTKATPLEFEKDDDQNFHIDFVAAASNLRAGNYAIPLQDKMKVKLVAGKIIPAIATTTSAVTGLSLIELLKVLQGKDVSTLRNGMLDVGTNNYVLFERDPPKKNNSRIVTTYLPEQDYTYKKKIICVPEGFTKYDMIPVKVTPRTTLQQFVDTLTVYLNATLNPDAEEKYEVDGIGVGKGMIWNGRPSHANTNRPIMEIIAEQKEKEAGGSLPCPFWEGRTRFFELAVTVSIDCDDEVDEVDVETAEICLRVSDE